jgi:outer membrane protein
MRILAVFLLSMFYASAETKTMTLRQALDLALQQNPDLMLARLDQQRAREQVTIQRDPFVPKVFGGSGAAWTSGFPGSIEGSAPSIFQVKTQMALFDRPQSYLIAQANENLRGAAIDIGVRQEEIVYRVASLFLDAEQAGRSLAAAQRETENLAKVRELVDATVSESRALPIESKRADLAARRAKLNLDSLAVNLINAETSLALVLGLKPDDRVRATPEERPSIAMPVSEEQSIEEAIENSREIKRLESNMQSKMLEIKSYKAMRLPKVNLVAQYELFAKYTYQGYFTKFQRNNGQVGASFEIPLLVGHASRAYVLQADTDMAKLRIEMDRTRARITADLRRAFQEVKRAESAREVARLELEVARDQITIDLAQNDEGRLPLAKVEQDRALENEKWLAYYETQHTAESARLNVLRQTGTLLAMLKQ